MGNKKIINLLATALVINNLSPTVVLAKDINNSNYSQIGTVKNNGKTTSKHRTSFLDDREENTAFIEDYNTLLKERTVYTEKEFISLIKNSKVNMIRLATDLDLTKYVKDNLEIIVDNLIIDGQGNNITFSSNSHKNKDEIISIMGENIVLKNIGFGVNKLKDGKSIVNILGNGIKLDSVNINSENMTALKIYDCNNITLENINVSGVQAKNTAIIIDNANVKCKGTAIEGTTRGIEVVGRKGCLDIIGDLKVNSPIGVKCQFKGGASVNDLNNILSEPEKVFGYEYYKVLDKEI